MPVQTVTEARAAMGPRMREMTPDENAARNEILRWAEDERDRRIAEHEETYVPPCGWLEMDEVGPGGDLAELVDYYDRPPGTALVRVHLIEHGGFAGMRGYVAGFDIREHANGRRWTVYVRALRDAVAHAFAVTIDEIRIEEARRLAQHPDLKAWNRESGAHRAAKEKWDHEQWRKLTLRLTFEQADRNHREGESKEFALAGCLGIYDQKVRAECEAIVRRVYR